MKLSRLYCNVESTFNDIIFNDGLNVVFAQVKDYSAKNKSAHNLGKTFLTTVIDFCLLSGVDQYHAFRKHPDRFSMLVFFLEIKTNSGEFVTVRRQVTGPKSISIHRSDSSSDLRSLPLEEWHLSGLGEKGARKALNNLLELTSLSPYDFRKGLGYFLRRQNDYDDLYRITKFGRGRDLDWKPFMALLLGFNWQLLEEKYSVDDQIAEIKGEIALVEGEAGAPTSHLDEIRSKIQVLEESISNRRGHLDSFSFYEADLDITIELVESIEKEIGKLNEVRYNLISQLEEVHHALKTELPFDIERVRLLFEEAGIYFSSALIRDYDELLAFNRELAVSRKGRLEDHSRRLDLRISKLNRELQELDQRRTESLDAIKKAETFEKFKVMQRRLLKDEEDLLTLRSREERLDAVAGRRGAIRSLEIHRIGLIEKIEAMIDAPPEHYLRVRRMYSENARQVLDVFAFLSVFLNGNGNMEFDDSTTKDALLSNSTSENDGNSYKKMLCACFDLALLASFSKKSFYRFVYHDGIFEALDERKKSSLLHKIHELVKVYDIQYILTVIDSDLPRSASDEKLYFQENEIVLQLHDGGDDGRLFKGPVF